MSCMETEAHIRSAEVDLFFSSNRCHLRCGQGIGSDFYLFIFFKDSEGKLAETDRHLLQCKYKMTELRS